MTKIYFQIQAGFTFIEVLIAVSLIALFMVEFKEIQLTALQFHQQAYFRMIATEQLSSMSVLIRLKSQNILDRQIISSLLPQGRAEMIRDHGQIILRIFWRCRAMDCWNCKIKSQPNRACEELRVLA